MNKSFLLALVSIMIFVGAGCSSSPSADSTSDNPATSPASNRAVVAADAGASTQLTAATTDDTWSTYVSKSLGFSFMWPTKGRNAPQWEVSALALDDSRIVDGCWDAEKGTAKQKVAVGDAAFCHSSNLRKSGGMTTFVDEYVTKGPSSYIAISFSKTVYPSPEKNCGTAGFTTVKGVCSPFDEKGYRAFLDGVVGTFKKSAE